MTSRLWIGTALIVTVAAARAADTRVAEAAQNHDLKAVQTLIAKKADVNAALGDGSTALHWAAFNDDLEMAKALLAAGASLKAQTRIGALTPLSMAAKNGNAAMLDLMIKAGGDPSSEDEHGTTLLMAAAASGSADAVKVLLEHGANVNAREGVHGETALMFAASLNRSAAIRVLVEHGADPNLASKAVKLPKPAPRFADGGGSLPETKDAKPGEAKAGEANAGAAKAAPARPDADKAALDTLAASLGLKSAVYNAGGKPGEGDLKDALQKLTAKVDAIEKRLPGEKKDDNADGNGSQFGIIRERGTLDMGGMSALLFAARDGQIDAARELLEGGADINQVSTSEKTSPLVMAIMNGHFDLARLLLEWGADPNLANDLGLTALYAVIDQQWAPKGWFPAASVAQEKTTYLELMEALLEDGANPNARIKKKLWFRSFGDHSWVDTAGATAFWRAASSTDVGAMKLLVKYGADPDIPTLGGTTPLEAASGIGWGYHYSMNAPDYTWLDAVKYCVELGADVNAADARGYTPLHGAAYIGNNELIQYLVDHGADVKAVAKDKNTVADMANGPTRFGIPHAETVALLEKLGSANSHNCRSDHCLVAPKDDKKPATSTTAAPPAGEAKKPGER
jgi:ankyrin repeat protein